MKRGRLALSILTLVCGLTLAEARNAQAGGLAGLFGRKTEPNEQTQAAALVPLDSLPPALRDKVSHVLARPTLYARGPFETFEGRPELYNWLLDHPDRAVVAWRRLGAKCLDIEDRGRGNFGWADSQGSDIVWTAIYNGPSLRIWFAEGQVKPGALFPLVPVQCVVILRHSVVNQESDVALMQHQADVFAYTDSKTATLVTRMMGASVPRMAKQGAGQLQMFFGAMTWYCGQHPKQAETLLRPETHPVNPASRMDTPFNANGMVYPQGFPSETSLPRE